MKGKGVTLGWQVSEEREWIVEDLAAKENRYRHQFSRQTVWRVVFVGICSLLALIVAISAFVSRAERNLSQIADDVAEAYVWDEWMQTHADTAPLDPLAPRAWQRSMRAQEKEGRSSFHRQKTSGDVIEKTEVDGDMVLVHLAQTEGPAWLGSPYREIRFYRATEDGWMRSAPDKRFWGMERHVETAHFSIEYRARDSDAAQASVDAIEETYLQLRRQVGLGPPPADERLTIRILPTIVPGMDWMGLQIVSGELRVPSPLLVPRSKEVSDRQTLSQLIGSVLAKHVMNESLKGRSIACSWQPLVDGLNLYAAQKDSALPSPSRYRLESLLQQRIMMDPPLALTDLQSTDCWWYRHQVEHGSTSQAWVQIAASAELVNHIQVNYGEDRLPELILALESFNTWEELIPAVFDTEAAEFERGWQQSLQ